MAKTVALPAGQIIKGDFCGQYLYRWDGTSWGVCPGAKLENSMLAGKLRWHTEDYSRSGNWFGPTSDDLISESTVDHYVEIGSQSSGPDASVMLKGSLIGGVGLGLIAGAASTSESSDVAIYLKNGKNFVVRFSNAQCWLDLKSMLYTLDQPQIEESLQPKTEAVPSLDRFEAIKKYKELLDMGIITQKEFDSKKNELLGLHSERELSQPNAVSGKRSDAEQAAIVDEIANQAISFAKIWWGPNLPPAIAESTNNLSSIIGKELLVDEIPLLSVGGCVLGNKIKVSEINTLPKPYHLWVYRFIVFTDKCRMRYCYGQLGKKNEIGQCLTGSITFDKRPEILSSQQKKQMITTIKFPTDKISIECSVEAGRYLNDALSRIFNE